MNFNWRQGFFSCIIISKIGVKMNFRIITRNHGAVSKIGSTKIDFRADWTNESHPGVWEVSFKNASISIWAIQNAIFLYYPVPWQKITRVPLWKFWYLGTIRIFFIFSGSAAVFPAGNICVFERRSRGDLLLWKVFEPSPNEPFLWSVTFKVISKP